MFTRDFWQASALNFYHKNGFDSVTVLAYTTLVSLVPFLAIMMSVLSFSSAFETFQASIMEQVVHHLLPSSTPVVESYLVSFSEQALKLKWPGIIVMFITVLLLLWKVDQKINAMWDQPSERQWWMSLIHYLGVTLLGPILLGASLAISSLLMAAPLVYGLTFKGFFEYLPFLFNLLGFWLLYYFVPVHRVSKLDALRVALLAALLIEGLKQGFTAYVTWFPTYDLIYGAFAAIPLFLLWLYLLWLIVIFSASVLHELSKDDSTIPQQTKAD